jgi:DNA topoisomerase-6 subunit B
MIHMASVWVPFTSESKEAIADYDEIRKEMKLALMECGRKLGAYLRKRKRMERESARRDVFERYIGEISKAISAINGTDAARLYEKLLDEARKRTAVADLELDEDGKAIKRDETDHLKEDDGVVMVQSRAAHLASLEAGDSDDDNDGAPPPASTAPPKPDRESLSPASPKSSRSSGKSRSSASRSRGDDEPQLF